MAKGKRRRRVSREDIRDNARKGGGGASYFKLPSGVRQFSPTKAGTIKLDIVPYEVKSENHPDGRGPGDIWYKYPFAVHHGIGVRNDSFVCLASVGKKCPVCQERERLTNKDKEEYAKVIKKLWPQKFVAYNIDDPDDKKKDAVFAMSRGKFAVALEKEIGEDEDVTYFYDTTDEGRTLKVRFSDATFEGNKFIEATRIDFIKRDERDEEETLDRSVVLEECFNILPYDKLKAIFLEINEDDADNKKDDDDDKSDESGGKEEIESGDGDDDNDKDEKPSEKDEDSSDTDSKDDVPPDEKEKEVEKPKDKKKEEKKSGDSEKCPVDGGKYGKEADTHKECDDCPLWDDCDDLTTG